MILIFYQQIFRDFETQITANFYQRKSADIKIINLRFLRVKLKMIKLSV
jgi:hypothetical protein